MMEYTIYTDGSCLKNPNGPGGWAAVIFDNMRNTRKEISGGEESTTNNRMELTAALEAMKSIKDISKITLYTDSQYLFNTFEKHWIDKWKRNGWKTMSGAGVLNKDLWVQLDELYNKHKVEFVWVKGHDGNPTNERCDELAVEQARKYAKHARRNAS